MAKYFLIAGEASGDAHAAALIRQILQHDSEASFAGFGGDQMAKAGCVLFRHIQHMAFMGFSAVISHWRDIKSNFSIAHESLLREQPDVLILIDYPSFNLRMAGFCRKHLPDTRIVYYIPPKVWAWKRRRIHKIARLCDEVLGIFPFEPAFYQQYGYKCTYVGNPTIEEISLKLGKQKDKVNHPPVAEKSPITNSIAILPGSRTAEISHCLPKMLNAAQHFPEYNIIVCAAPGIDDDFYTPYITRTHATLVRDTYDVLKNASAAIVNSGTATLETALIGCPQVAVYHLAAPHLIGIIRWAQPLFFSIKHFTLVNIIAGKEIIKEYIADDFTVANIIVELERLLHDETYKKEMLASYDHLFSILGSQPAAPTAAAIITSPLIAKPVNMA